MKKGKFYICPVCQTFYRYDYGVCNFCGWEELKGEEKEDEWVAGPNRLSFNIYKKVFLWGLGNAKTKKDVLSIKNKIFDNFYQAPLYYQTLTNGEMVEIKQKISSKIEMPPFKCRLCGLGDIKRQHDTCDCCGWMEDFFQQLDKNFSLGANILSYNNYLRFWKENCEEILKARPNSIFKAQELSKQYFINILYKPE